MALAVDCSPPLDPMKYGKFPEVLIVLDNESYLRQSCGDVLGRSAQGEKRDPFGPDAASLVSRSRDHQKIGVATSFEIW